MGPLARLRRRIVAPFLLAQAPVGELSRGAGIGLWIALVPIVGQLYWTPALWALLRPIARLRFNLPVALGMVLLINPPLKVPLFYGYLLSGEALLGAAGWHPAAGAAGFRAADFRNAMAGLADAPWYAWPSYEWLGQVGGLLGLALERYALPLFVGGMAWAAALGLMAWGGTAWVLTRVRQRPK